MLEMIWCRRNETPCIRKHTVAANTDALMMCFFFSVIVHKLEVFQQRSYLFAPKSSE